MAFGFLELIQGNILQRKSDFELVFYEKIQKCACLCGSCFLEYRRESDTMPNSQASCTLERNQQLRGLIEIRIDFKRKKPSLIKGKEDTKLESFAAYDGSRNIAAKAESLLGTLIRMVARENSRYFATPWLVSTPNHI